MFMIHHQPPQDITTDFVQLTVDASPFKIPVMNFIVNSDCSASQRVLRSGALRYATFQNGWPHRTLPPRTLSEAGLFYRGPADETQCAFCRVTFSQWEPNDDPMTEHRNGPPPAHLFWAYQWALFPYLAVLDATVPLSAKVMPIYRLQLLLCHLLHHSHHPLHGSVFMVQEWMCLEEVI